ncbi:acyl-CoA carboxylase subunit epsilon [Streptosporangium subroseum]|uniref:Acyl-CoA carboxylase epsilon subunit n=1 Tax=Streptosporangium subroseum TaxID=106412 RepID=A0A239CVH7_9ACTN|nr:acyl-CoA carboxylase subunit epsilon [Streptosporangium subroseum]WSA21823.1 acyl-CoA carboxylase subunit epsilon [Streptosporangium subroseum]SNS24215.1 Acyl-CoA carboxylase epsilon subunit [Streptosporangium subroseum]
MTFSIEVVSGLPDEVELAALTAVLLTARRRRPEPAEPPRRAEWTYGETPYVPPNSWMSSRR